MCQSCTMLASVRRRKARYFQLNLSKDRQICLKIDKFVLQQTNLATSRKTAPENRVLENSVPENPVPEDRNPGNRNPEIFIQETVLSESPDSNFPPFLQFQISRSFCFKKALLHHALKEAKVENLSNNRQICL